MTVPFTAHAIGMPVAGKQIDTLNEEYHEPITWNIITLLNNKVACRKLQYFL
jgi:hypothetical protein